MWLSSTIGPAILVAYGCIIEDEICGKVGSGRIIGGEDAPLGGYPWQGLFDFSLYSCGLSLIDNEWAITAAHCVTPNTVATLNGVLFGLIKSDGSDATVQTSVDRIYVHPGYNPFPVLNDIALLHLDPPVSYSLYVRPICLETNSDETSRYDTCLATGFGGSPDILQQVELDLQEKDECVGITISDNHICAGGYKKGGCPGDSGGPLACQREDGRFSLVGITSFISTFNGTCGDSSTAFTRVSQYNDFIQNVIENRDTTPNCEPVAHPVCADVLPYINTYATSQEDLFSTVDGFISYVNNERFGGDAFNESVNIVCSLAYRDCSDDPARKRIQPCRQLCADLGADLCLFPIGETPEQEYCPYGPDPVCSGHFNLTDYPITIKSPNFPEEYFPLTHCQWTLSAPEGYLIFVKQVFFQTQSYVDNIVFGSGTDPEDLSSSFWRGYGALSSGGSLLNKSDIWITFTPDKAYQFSGFEYQFLAVLRGTECREGFFMCVNKRICIPDFWVCDGVKDCSDGEDESSEMCPGAMSCSVGEPCPGDHEECQTIEQKGSLVPECVCVAGYSRVDDNCTDINECVHPERNTCNSEIETCLNEDGTFTCECKPQFIDGDSCNPDLATPPPYLCGIRPASGRVVGGHDSEEGASPWIGSLRAEEHACGATLIGQRWAITAAHCIGYFNEIVLGDLKLDSVSPYHQKRTVTAFQHPGYDRTRYQYLNDIALLFLSTSADINSYVRPACLAMSQSEVTTYSNCFIAGWGATSEGGTTTNTLQEAAVELITDDECRNFYGDDFDPESMICAGFAEGGIDACQGDSGGPLVCQGENDLWHLVGITSFGQGCARPEYPGVYTRVSKYATFIEDVQNYDFLECSDGTVLLSSERCNYIQDCEGGSDEAECDPIPIGTSISLSSPDYPESYPSSANVVYFITGEKNSHLYIQFGDFNLENRYDLLYVGYGSSPNDNSTVATLTGAKRPGELIIEHNVGWLRFTSDRSITRAGFLAQITVIGSDDFIVCSSGDVASPDSVCDQIVDCTDEMEDETDCEPLPNGSSFTFESPNYPDEYPNDYTRTYLFVAEDRLRIKLTFDHFDLEKKYDTLTIGHGRDPYDAHSVLAVLSGPDMPDEIISPNYMMWMIFATDSMQTKTGFRLKVTVFEDSVGSSE